MPLFIMSAILTKDKDWRKEIMLTDAYGVCASEAEARGLFQMWVAKNYPDYLIATMRASPIPSAVIVETYTEMNSED